MKLSVSKILQISNDISEGECTASAKQLEQVVLYFRGELDKWISAFHKQRTELLLFALKQNQTKTPKP